MSVIKEIEKSFKKPHVVDVKSGDTVRVHQKIREGNKERVQVFEGLVIQTKRKNSLSSTIVVRRIASGIGVEKSFLVHSPLVTKIEVVKRSKVRRNYLSYMRERTGKSARLSAMDFDQDKVNYVPEPEIKEEPKAENPEGKQAEANPSAEEAPAEKPAQAEAKADEDVQKDEKAASKKTEANTEAKSEEKPKEEKK